MPSLTDNKVLSIIWHDHQLLRAASSGHATRCHKPLVPKLLGTLNFSIIVSRVPGLGFTVLGFSPVWKATVVSNQRTSRNTWLISPQDKVSWKEGGTALVRV